MRNLLAQEFVSLGGLIEPLENWQPIRELVHSGAAAFWR